MKESYTEIMKSEETEPFEEPDIALMIDPLISVRPTSSEFHSTNSTNKVTNKIHLQISFETRHSFFDLSRL